MPCKLYTTMKVLPPFAPASRPMDGPAFTENALSGPNQIALLEGVLFWDRRGYRCYFGSAWNTVIRLVVLHLARATSSYPSDFTEPRFKRLPVLNLLFKIMAALPVLKHSDLQQDRLFLLLLPRYLSLYYGCLRRRFVRLKLCPC